METLDTVKTLLDLGLTGMLLYFLFIVWGDRRDTIKDKDARLSEKDEQLMAMHGAILTVVKENTKASVELKGSIDANTKSSDTLTARVYEALKGKQK